MRTTLLLTGLLLLANPLAAQPVYVCPSDTDEATLFSDLPCDEARQEGAIGIISGMDDRGKNAPPRTASPPAPRATPTAPSAARPPRPQRLSFGERARLRGLEIERDGLERDLRKRHSSTASRSRARQRLTQVNREIGELERRQQ
ncbi:hypothetical protein K8B33_07810 [Alcanivorax sp. JB21]|uniref:hypothetical protein n=1 Tax=Alcanivorax limicola TaxID=2874102 RepID=UPI001CBB6369|nr:hypothetical protein [Alcanivorax limicola]MBZ2188998.1 hypothetical protein [Alcanivorax limicola]